ncbi:hypothetical protein J2W91_004725 [Paenibacillus amylolyticus]|uniref:Uncharacterized protein n=1 Tax=Paenibacillus amylolyticus TaxID=1451 RepID=A0AAP5H4K9_PAEAM|nr:hypothetical protein [Paenibacillus amylolyticus]MDR6726219.1 hypothetical protein [Paenibacillus amylolyticus]
MQLALRFTFDDTDTGESYDFDILHDGKGNPQEVQHRFKKDCPYCGLSGAIHSVCPKHANTKGDLMTRWNAVNLKNVVHGKKTYRKTSTIDRGGE